MRNKAIYIILLVAFTMLLNGCQEEKSFYDRLSDEQRQIIDNIYANRESWETLQCSYEDMSAQGETCFRRVLFATNGSNEVFFHVNHALNDSATWIREDIYKCDASSFVFKDYSVQYFTNASCPKTWETTMEESEKKNELARLLLEALK